MKALLRELRRRNVWRAMLLYLGATWALAQGISELSAPLGLPEWAPRAFLIASAIGFPFWIAFAWLYELTPEGLKRESEVDEAASITRQTGRKLDYWIIGVLAVAVVLLLTDRLMPAPAQVAPEDTRSIAVLPLVNAASGDEDDYFSDGLTEELISGLTQIADLRVVGRTSAFAFKGSNQPRLAIARELGVTHLLEGNVRRDGEQVRIMLELIRPGDGTSLWSQTYQRRMRDIFAVQADIARAVATALQARFGEGPIDYTRPPGGNLAAYQATQQGRSIARKMTRESLERAAALHRRAIELEPDYAFAHASLANTLTLLALKRAHTSDARLRAEALDAAVNALRIAPAYFFSHMAHGYVLQVFDSDMDAAGAAYRRARELAPNEGAPALFLANYMQATGRYEESIALIQEALRREPLRVDWQLNLVESLQSAGRHEESLQAMRRVLEIEPDNAAALVWMGYVMREEGRREESIEYFRRAIASDPDNMTARAHLSFTMEDDGQSDAAVATLREALAFAPDHAELHHAMSDVSLRQGRYADALLHGRRAQEGAPNSMYFRAAHAWALANLDRLEEAEQVVRDGLELSPDAPGLNAQLAGIAALRGDHATVRMATEAETDPQSRRQLQALVAVMEGDDAALDARIEALLGNCQTRRVHCLQAAASLRASAGHTKALYALLDHLEQEPAYRAALGDPVFRPYYTDPRYLRHLEKYGRSPPSPVSQDNAPH